MKTKTPTGRAYKDSVKAILLILPRDLIPLAIPDALPQLPLSLTEIWQKILENPLPTGMGCVKYRDTSIEVAALLDTGASVNVLPYSLGVQRV
ncbi:MAG: hypothetical protein SAK29_08985 [Scytonema sp. PMC 1069.18]|nr:hypothetical protein [Scytonema sp. PMC 1069.18]MEC4884633.1 hypothetical protein [Scytonema sp. PMC 1070.18]